MLQHAGSDAQVHTGKSLWPEPTTAQTPAWAPFCPAPSALCSDAQTNTCTPPDPSGSHLATGIGLRAQTTLHTSPGEVCFGTCRPCHQCVPHHQRQGFSKAAIAQKSERHHINSKYNNRQRFPACSPCTQCISQLPGSSLPESPGIGSDQHRLHSIQKAAERQRAACSPLLSSLTERTWHVHP